VVQFRTAGRPGTADLDIPQQIEFSVRAQAACHLVETYEQHFAAFVSPPPALSSSTLTGLAGGLPGSRKKAEAKRGTVSPLLVPIRRPSERNVEVRGLGREPSGVTRQSTTCRLGDACDSFIGALVA